MRSPPKESSPTPPRADEVASLSPRAVVTSVLLRLTSLPPAATALARSIAVLEQAAPGGRGDRRRPGPQPAPVQAADALVGAGVLASGPILTFVHPIVRTAIYRDLSAVERGLTHQRAARVLADRGQTRIVWRRICCWSPLARHGRSRLLRGAGARAAALGAPATAAAYLGAGAARARPEAGTDRVDLLIELGDTELAAGLPAGIGHLREAVELADDPGRLTGATIALARGSAMAETRCEAVEMLEAARPSGSERRSPRGARRRDARLRCDQHLSAAASRRLARRSTPGSRPCAADGLGAPRARDARAGRHPARSTGRAECRTSPPARSPASSCWPTAGSVAQVMSMAGLSTCWWTGSIGPSGCSRS